MRAISRGESTAKVFLSYARPDVKKAKRLANALAGAGHSVWWDFAIGAGARFGDAIDAALKDADAVVVLWSAASVGSSWVRDEAAAGRDSGRLVPILLDATEPPLGFRQYQCISLADWSGRGKPPFMPQILSTIATLGSAGPEPAASPAGVRKLRLRLPRLGLLVAAAVAIAAIGALLWFDTRSNAAPPLVIVATSKSAPVQPSAALAQEVVLNLGRIQEGPLSRISIRRPDQSGASNADYRIEIGQRSAGDGELGGEVVMLDRRNIILWTTNVEVPAGRVADLGQQLAAQIGSVLACSVRVPSLQPRPTGDLLKLYLSGCATLYGTLGAPEDQTYNTFEQITAEQPKLADGWAGLALLEAGVGPSAVGSDYARIRKMAVDHLQRAKKLNPDLDLVYAAETRLESDGNNYGAVIDALERGTSEYPESALLYYDLAAAYQRVGRINDSVESAHNALLLNPLSTGAISSYVFALAFSGNLKGAQQQLDQAERTWPGSEQIEIARYYFDLRYGKAPDAGSVAKQYSEIIQPTAAEEALIAARASPTKANVDRAIQASELAYRANPNQALNLLQALGTFGRVDEAFAMMRSAPTDYLIANSDTFFRPNMRSIRNDVRFIAEANRLGLTKVWKRTGNWPDFCADPQLPYDCRKEAAKFAD